MQGPAGDQKSAGLITQEGKKRMRKYAFTSPINVCAGEEIELDVMTNFSVIAARLKHNDGTIETLGIVDRTLFSDLLKECSSIQPVDEDSGKHPTAIALYKDGDSFGITTALGNHDEFVSYFGTLLAVMIDENVFQTDWEFQLEGWLPMFFKIAARLLKGRKIEPLIVEGDFNESDMIAAIDTEGAVFIDGVRKGHRT
jgi:hypothetical protein